MAEFLYLKSKLLKAADPWKVDVSQFCIPLTVNEALYEKDLLNFRRRFATTEDVGEVAAQDMVTLTCDSENKRFCKEHITIRIGMGLFSKELEAALEANGVTVLEDEPMDESTDEPTPPSDL